MKFRIWMGTSAISLFALFAVPGWLSAQGTSTTSGPTHYQVYNLGTLGGTNSGGNGINNLDVVTGVSTLTGNQIYRATMWLYGQKIDLGALGGAMANSGVEWPVKNDKGTIVGISETSKIDPNNEGGFSCSAFIPINDGHTCLAFLWRNGTMTALPTLGGNNGFATGINNLGQAVGWSETARPDSTCIAPQVLQFEATEWGPANGEIHALPPLAGDEDSAATAINGKGQVVGISGECGDAVGAYSAKHAVMWQNAQPIYLGGLGGHGWNTPMAINNLGQVAGFADLPGDTSTGSLIPNFHAFLWTQDSGMRDLGTLPNQTYSEATGINDSGQVVGLSCDANFNCTAVIWQNGTMTNLNSLILPNSNLYLISAGDVNNQGEITGQACVLSGSTCTEFVAFLAVPSTSVSGATGNTTQVTIPERFRERIKREIGMGAFATPHR